MSEIHPIVLWLWKLIVWSGMLLLLLVIWTGIVALIMSVVRLVKES